MRESHQFAQAGDLLVDGDEDLIVVPTRFGLTSSVALCHALRLAGSGYAIVALHVRSSAAAAERARAPMDRLLRQHGNPPYLLECITIGDPLEALVAASRVAKLLVIGLPRCASLGATREHILARSHCPVLLAAGNPDVFANLGN